MGVFLKFRKNEVSSPGEEDETNIRKIGIFVGNREFLNDERIDGTILYATFA